MTESLTTQDSFKRNSSITGYYLNETPKSILIKLSNGISFWVPKRFIDSTFSPDEELKQDFLIEDWILRKIGFNFPER